MLWFYATRRTGLSFQEHLKSAAPFFCAYIVVVAFFHVGASIDVLPLLTDGRILEKSALAIALYGAFVAYYRFAGSMSGDMRFFLDRDVGSGNVRR